MKLEVGMYCYNKTNRKLGIGKIIDFQSNNNANIRYKNSIELASIGNVIASFNIIDILEVGDYVNGKKIYSLGLTIGILNTINFEDGTFTIAEDIKSVITHEQMEQMAYKVGE